MLDDLFSSSKGPGVIGLLLGLIVLAGFCGLGFAVFDGRLNGDFNDGRRKEAATNVRQIEKLKNQIRTYSDSEGEWRKVREDAKKLEEVRRAIAIRKPKGKALQAEVAEAEEEKKAANQEWESYKEQYRAFARARLVGTTFEKLATPGRVYENVKVTSVTALEMKFSHANGVTGVKLALLDDKIKDDLQFDEGKANEVAAAIKKDQKILGAAATAQQKIAALKARISHINLNIEQNDKKIAVNERKKAGNSAESSRLRSRARVLWAKFREDRAAGRPSRADDNARAAETRADALLKANGTLNAQNSRLRLENGEYRSKIGEAEREKTKIVRKAKEEAKAAKKEGKAAEGTAGAAPGNQK